jgi:hypothetical protein
MSVIVFGSIFVDNLWKIKFIESREEFADGLNLFLPIVCGRAERFVTIPSHRVDAFFNAIGRSATPESAADVKNFFERYFNSEGCDLRRQRSQMKDKFMLDVGDVELMLRQALWHCEFVYDEEETALRLRNRRSELIFPFYIEEWYVFVEVLRKSLIGIDLMFDLYDDGKLAIEEVSIVSDIEVVDEGVACRRLMAYLDG